LLKKIKERIGERERIGHVKCLSEGGYIHFLFYYMVMWFEVERSIWRRNISLKRIGLAT